MNYVRLGKLFFSTWQNHTSKTRTELMHNITVSFLDILSCLWGTESKKHLCYVLCVFYVKQHGRLPPFICCSSLSSQSSFGVGFCVRSNLHTVCCIKYVSIPPFRPVQHVYLCSVIYVLLFSALEIVMVCICLNVCRCRWVCRGAAQVSTQMHQHIWFL